MVHRSQARNLPALGYLWGQWIPESWSFFNGQIGYEDYLRQFEGFTAARYDPDAWADLFKRAGANYAVLTAKHHDGVALWNTACSDLNVVKRSPAARDLVGPYCAAVRAAGLHVGLYFSHLDWSHPDYASVCPPWPVDLKHPGNRFNRPADGRDDLVRWERFLKFHRGQLKELCERYRPELLWFDGSWERTRDQWRFEELRDQLQAWSPGVVLNSRMGFTHENPRGAGDYLTPEQALPVARPEGAWEFSMTVNDSWGWHANDVNYKSVRQLVRYFTECVSMGGNLLLDVGPMPDGTIHPEQASRLEGLGMWIAPRAEAIYPTGAGLPPGHFHGGSTLTKDRRTIYLLVYDRPWDRVAVKGIHPKVQNVSVVGGKHHGQKVAHKNVGGADWLGVPGMLWIDVPDAVHDENCTVLKIELEGQLELYTGAGQAITQN